MTDQRGKIERRPGGRAPRASPQRRRTGRSPYSKSNRADREGMEVDLLEADMMKISAGTHTKGAAGKLAHEAREGHLPTLLAIGSSSINQAMKAITVARSYLEDDSLDLSCQPAFREGMSDLSMAIYLRKKSGNSYKKSITADELVVKDNTMRKNLAGAIANRVRDGNRVYLLAKGPEAVSNALSAICHARAFLESDNIDLHCAPRFIKLEDPRRAGEESTYLRMDITADRS